MHINLKVIVEYRCGGDSYNQNHMEYVSQNIHLAGPSKDNDKNCIMLIFEDNSNCMEMKSIVSKAITAP